MGSTSKILKNTIFLYLRSFIVLLISLYTSRVVLKVLGVEDFGIYNAVGGVISMISFVNTSLIAAFQRYYNVVMGEGIREELRLWFRSSLSSQLLLVFLILLLAETVGLWFLNNVMVIPETRIVAANWIFQASTVAVIFSVFQAPYTAIVTACEKMNIFAIISVIDAFLKLVIVLSLQFVDADKLIVYSVLLMLVSLFNLSFYIIYVEGKLDLGRFSFVWQWKKIISLFTFAGYSFVDMLSQTLKSSGLNVLLNVFFGPVVNAARGLAYQVLSATNQFVKSFQLSFQPQLTMSYAENNFDYLNRLYFSASKISFFMILIITVPIIVETDAILHIWLGDNVPDHTVAFIRLILVTSWVSCFANPTSVIIYATGQMKKFTMWVSGLNLAILPVAYIFLKLGFVPESAMVVSLVITVIVQMVRMAILKNLVNISIIEYFKKVLLPSFGVCMTSFVLPLLFHNITNYSVINSIVNCSITVIWIVLAVWLIGTNKEEKQFILSKVNAILKK